MFDVKSRRNVTRKKVKFVQRYNKFLGSDEVGEGKEEGWRFFIK